jgi:hypothetical protein
MLTPLGTKEDDDSKTSTEYYYTQQQQHHHYYCPVPFNDESNNLHPSIYDTNQYYSGYLHQQIHNHVNEEDSNNQIPSSVYIPTYHYHPHYSPEGHTTEMLYSKKASDPPVYDYNLSPVPTNPVFHQQHSNYVQPSIDQANCTTSNSADYLRPYVSQQMILYEQRER